MMTKAEVLKSLERLPEDATIEDMMEHLHVLYEIERRIALADAGETISQEEARARMKRWLR